MLGAPFLDPPERAIANGAGPCQYFEVAAALAGSCVLGALLAYFAARLRDDLSPVAFAHVGNMCDLQNATQLDTQFKNCFLEVLGNDTNCFSEGVDMDVGTTKGQTGSVFFQTTSADSQRLPQMSDEEPVSSGSQESKISSIHHVSQGGSQS